MTVNASAGALSKFFSKNYRPLYQFILRLYVTSLTAEHPDRGRKQTKSNGQQESNADDYTLKEHQIMAEWANLLTDDHPLQRRDSDPLDPEPDPDAPPTELYHSDTVRILPDKQSSRRNTIDVDDHINGPAETTTSAATTSPIASSTSKAASTYGLVFP